MTCYEPELPKMTISEVEDQDTLSYKIVMEVVRHAALHLYNASPATHKLGLEKCMEVIIDLINTGYAKVLWTEDPDGDTGQDRLSIGYFNSATGRYQRQGGEECEESWECEDE